jgi:7-cyano-7-deazaguanine synthase in queuosine biosynthesis
MQTLVLSGGGLKSAFLLAVARREDGQSPLILHFKSDTVIGHMRARAVAKLAAFYDSNLISMTLTDVLVTPMRYLEVLHSLIHAVPVARQYECYRIYFGWSRDNWRECLNLYHTDTITNFIHITQKVLAAVQTVYLTSRGCAYLAPSEIEMPFYLLRDEQILQLGTAYSSPWEMTYDCLSGTLIHCGKCAGCLQRQALFVKADIPDLTIYQTNRTTTKGMTNGSEPEPEPEPGPGPGDGTVGDEIGSCDSITEMSRDSAPSGDFQ